VTVIGICYSSGAELTGVARPGRPLTNHSSATHCGQRTRTLVGHLHMVFRNHEVMLGLETYKIVNNERRAS